MSTQTQHGNDLTGLHQTATIACRGARTEETGGFSVAVATTRLQLPIGRRSVLLVSVALRVPTLAKPSAAGAVVGLVVDLSTDDAPHAATVFGLCARPAPALIDMTPALLMLLAATAAGGHSHAGGLAMFEWGKDPAPGLLVNHSAGARPWDPIDPAKPTFAIAPGLNPLHPLLKVTVAQRYGEQLSRRYGSSVNIVGWDWNGNSMHGLKARVNDELALRHGYAFATALRKAGAAPGKLHMIGQSAGCVVAAAAARALAAWHGQPVDRLTLIDPVVGEHPLIFGRLAAGSAAAHVEHFWAPGPSGYGQNAPYPGVRNASVPGPNGFKGVIHPLHSDHLHAVQWHIRQLTR